MGKIALFVPRTEMAAIARNLLAEKPYGISDVKTIRTNLAVGEASLAVANGATIIIARGLQASLIRENINVQVVEIVMTAQEMALLIKEAKRLVKKERPVISIIGFENMFSDMSYFNELFDIELRRYLVPMGERIEDAARMALDEKPDVVIGGELVVDMAGKDGIPAVFFTATEDSLRNAMESAVILDRAMESEKNHAAQIDTLLDYSFNAIVRIAPNKKILSVNSRMCDILEEREENLTDRNVQTVFPELSDESLRRVFDRGEEYVLLMQINKVRMITELVPVWSSGHVESAVMTSHRVREEGVTRSPIDRHNPNLLMPSASSHFNNIVQESPAMKRTVELGKIFATSPFPVLLEAEPGLHARNFAQSMHNIGPRRGRPYIEGDCRTMTNDAQMDRFFRDGGLLDTAGDGTLVILNIDSADERFFARLLPVFSRRRVKVICTSRVPVEELFQRGLIGEEAYSYLAALRIRIPPLRERPEDLEHFITLYFRRAYERQGRFHVMTKSAREYLMNCRWQGNEVQVHVFAERLVLTSAKRSIDEVSVRQAMDQFSHDDKGALSVLPQGTQVSSDNQIEESGNSPARYLTYSDRERQKIRKALQDNGGNRQLTAKALGISTTTLWRRMQKYGIRPNEQ